MIASISSMKINKIIWCTLIFAFAHSFFLSFVLKFHQEISFTFYLFCLSGCVCAFEKIIFSECDVFLFAEVHRINRITSKLVKMNNKYSKKYFKYMNFFSLYLLFILSVKQFFNFLFLTIKKRKATSGFVSTTWRTALFAKRRNKINVLKVINNKKN